MHKDWVNSLALPSVREPVLAVRLCSVCPTPAFWHVGVAVHQLLLWDSYKLQSEDACLRNSSLGVWFFVSKGCVSLVRFINAHLFP